MMLLGRAGLVLIFKLLLLISCIDKSDKRRVEKLNNEKFSSSNQRDEAQFLVNTIDKSYELLEAAGMAETRFAEETDRHLASEVIQRQARVASRLKAYAEKNSVTVPFSGPERAKKKTRVLHETPDGEFRQTWITHVQKLNSDLKDNIENYYPKADSSLRVLLDSTIYLMAENGEILASAKEN